MCKHDHEEENNIRFGWVCSRCNVALSPYLDTCVVCNELEDEDRESLQTSPERQDELLHDERLFENLKGN